MYAPAQKCWKNNYFLQEKLLFKKYHPFLKIRKGWRIAAGNIYFNYRLILKISKISLSKSTEKFRYIYIYILMRYWVGLSIRLSVCSCAIETTFPLSNFKTKHIFGILMALRKFLKLWMGREKKIGVSSAAQMVLKLPQGHEGSEYVLSF